MASTQDATASVTADHVAALRALVTNDDDTFKRLTGSVSAEWLDWLTDLLTGVFLSAVRYRFADEASRPDVIRFVARSRIRRGGDQAGFSAGVAESLMGTSLGINPAPGGLDQTESVRAQFVLLQDLAGELSFLDFESLLAATRAELCKLGTHAGGDGNEEVARPGVNPPRAAVALNPSDVLAVVASIKAQGDATASRVDVLETQVRNLQAMLDLAPNLGQ